MKTLGQVAYEAYCIYVNNLSVTGVVLPKWENQSNNLKGAWESAAIAVEWESIKRENEQYQDTADLDSVHDDYKGE